MRKLYQIIRIEKGRRIQIKDYLIAFPYLSRDKVVGTNYEALLAQAHDLKKGSIFEVDYVVEEFKEEQMV